MLILTILLATACRIYWTYHTCWIAAKQIEKRKFLFSLVLQSVWNTRDNLHSQKTETMQNLLVALLTLMLCILVTSFLPFTQFAWISCFQRPYCNDLITVRFQLRSCFRWRTAPSQHSPFHTHRTAQFSASRSKHTPPKTAQTL